MNNYSDQIKHADNLQKVVHDFLNIFLLEQKRSSGNTVRSYRRSIDALLDFIAKKNKTKTQNLTFEDFTRENIAAYLQSLTDARLSDSTRNQRRACFCSFISYAASVHPSLDWQCIQIHKVPIRHQTARCPEEALSISDINLLLKEIEKNKDTRLRFRDKAIVFMLYDTAARVNELLSIKLKDINLNRRDPYVKLLGKGKKERVVNLSKETVVILKDYAKIYGIDLDATNDVPLFFANHQGAKMPLDSNTIWRMLKRYEALIKQKHPSFKRKFHPHLLRASRATHLLSQGVDVYFISKFLGHADISTTEKYLRINMDKVREALRRAAEDPNNPLRHLLNPKKSNGNGWNFDHAV